MLSEEKLTRLEEALDYFPPKRRKEVEPLARRYLANYDQLKAQQIVPTEEEYRAKNTPPYFTDQVYLFFYRIYLRWQSFWFKYREYGWRGPLGMYEYKPYRYDDYFDSLPPARQRKIKEGAKRMMLEDDAIRAAMYAEGELPEGMGGTADDFDSSIYPPYPPSNPIDRFVEWLKSPSARGEAAAKPARSQKRRVKRDEGKAVAAK